MSRPRRSIVPFRIDVKYRFQFPEERPCNGNTQGASVAARSTVFLRAVVHASSSRLDIIYTMKKGERTPQLMRIRYIFYRGQNGVPFFFSLSRKWLIDPEGSGPKNIESREKRSFEAAKKVSHSFISDNDFLHTRKRTFVTGYFFEGRTVLNW